MNVLARLPPWLPGLVRTANRERCADSLYHVRKAARHAALPVVIEDSTAPGDRSAPFRRTSRARREEQPGAEQCQGA